MKEMKSLTVNGETYQVTDPNATGKRTAENGEIFNIYENTDVMGMVIPKNEAGFGGHAEGGGTKALGVASHTEGFNTQVEETATAGHAEGDSTIVRNIAGHAEGSGTEVDGKHGHAEGFKTKAEGDNAHAEGNSTQAIGGNSHAGGDSAIAAGGSSFAFGGVLNVDGEKRHTEATHYASVSLGQVARATNIAAVALGFNTTASGYASMAVNDQNEAQGNESFAAGYRTKATGSCQAVFGRANKTTEGALYVVGNGNSAIESNAFVVNADGTIQSQGAHSTMGADYAEFFEWLDGNPKAEDRIGLVVALDGEKIRLAQAGDDVLGIISGTAAILGDSAAIEWKNKYLTDEYGRTLYDMVEEFTEVVDGETGEKTQLSLGVFPHPRVNPAYDPNVEYIPRENRPEWDAVGMFGKLYVRDDGTCVAGGYCCVGVDGLLTHSEARTNIRVMKRTGDNIVLVLLK